MEVDMSLADFVEFPVLLRALVVGAFGGVGLALTTYFSRRGPLIFPVYAALLAALAVLLARYPALGYAPRYAAALGTGAVLCAGVAFVAA